MRIKTRLLRAAAITVSALALGLSSAASAATYILTELTGGDLDFASYTVTGLNELGQISGFGRAANGDTQGVYWNTGQAEARLVQVFRGRTSVTAGINESGRIVGTQTSFDGIQSAFTYDISTGNLNAFGLGRSIGNGINDAGMVVGSRALGTGANPFLYNPTTAETTFYDLPANAKSAEFNAITNDGHIIGSRTPFDPAFPDPAFDPQPTIFILENAFGSVPTDAFPRFRRTDFVAANNAGQFAVSFTFPGSPFFGTSVSLGNLDGSPTPPGAGLGRLPGDPANYGGGFNDQLDFVGESYNENRYGGSYGDAIITTLGGGTAKLSTLVTNLGSNFLQQGSLINNRGQIVAFGFNANGRRANFLLTPENMVSPGVPEPASWALMIAGFGLTGTALRRRAGTVSFSRRKLSN
jgi:PEP-CTERM motif